MSVGLLPLSFHGNLCVQISQSCWIRANSHDLILTQSPLQRPCLQIEDMSWDTGGEHMGERAESCPTLLWQVPLSMGFSSQEHAILLYLPHRQVGSYHCHHLGSLTCELFSTKRTCPMKRWFRRSSLRKEAWSGNHFPGSGRGFQGYGSCKSSGALDSQVTALLACMRACACSVVSSSLSPHGL